MPVVRISEELFREVQKHAEPLIDNFESALWKALGKSKTGKSVGQRGIKSRAVGELTTPKIFWKLILEVLIKRGGQASRQQVHNDIEQKVGGQLKPGDYEVNRDGTLKWSKQVDYQRLAMVHEGLLQNGLPRGIWGITDLGRQWLDDLDKEGKGI